MSIELLDRTRRINRLLHDNRSSKVAFSDVCNVLGELLMSNVYVISHKGKILGTFCQEGAMIACFDAETGKKIDKKINERFLNILSTKENVNLVTLGLPRADVGGQQALITPICIAGERLGTLFLFRPQEPYDIEDIILAEYGTTVVGLEMMRSVMEENEEKKRSKQVVTSAVSTLSSSEAEAMFHVVRELGGNEGTLIASRVAAKIGITRTVIVNALKKLESAGLVETHSGGMKGTHIRILNRVVCSELDQRHEQKRISKTQKEL